MNTYFFVLIGCALAVGAVCRYRNINPALPLVATGLIVEFLLPELATSLPDPELILTFVLAPLVFAAGLASTAVDLRRVRRSVLLLAVGLVVLTTAVVGVSAWAMFTTLTLASACCLGAILAPTDAVAAQSVASRTGLPRRVMLVIEGESLANDGTALTLLRVAIVAGVAGTVSFAQAGGILFAAVVGGVAVGALGGLLVSFLMRVAREPLVANSILLLTPFVLYEVSERIGGSGLLTVVIAGVWIAHTTWVRGNYRTRIQADSIWSLVIFLLESFAFVLVGAEFFETYNRIEGRSIPRLLILAVGLTLLIMLVRGLFMFVWLMIGQKFAPKRFGDRRRTAKEFVAIGLLGVRGPVSVLAAFSVPVLTETGDPFPNRDLILILTFGVVIVSLFFSLFSAKLITRLRLEQPTEAEALSRARIALAKAALRRLDEIVAEADVDGRTLNETIVNQVRLVTKSRISSLKTEPAKDAETQDINQQRQELRRELLQAERDQVDELRRSNMPGDVIRQLTRELDLREQMLAS